MKKIIIFILLLCPVLMYAEQLNAYTFIPVKIIQSGSNKGEIGWQDSPSGYTGPTTIYIGKNEILYVPDRVNNRINLYDLDITFLRYIIEKEKKYAHFTNKMKVDEKGNIIYITTTTGLQKIDSQGSKIYTVNYKILPRNVKNRHNFFPIDDVIFIYNDNNEIEYISSDGKIVGGKDVANKIIAFESDKLQRNSINLPPDKKNIVEAIQQDNSFLIINDNFYSANFRKTEEYFNKIKEVRNYVVSQKKETENKTIDLNINDFSMHFIGYDASHNSYWDGSIDKPNKTIKYAVIIYSKYGELLDAFYYGQYKIKADNLSHPDIAEYPTTGALIAVSPDGDVYFLKGNEKEYTFYKVENNW